MPITSKKADKLQQEMRSEEENFHAKSVLYTCRDNTILTNEPRCAL